MKTTSLALLSILALWACGSPTLDSTDLSSGVADQTKSTQQNSAGLPMGDAIVYAGPVGEFYELFTFDLADPARPFSRLGYVI